MRKHNTQTAKTLGAIAFARGAHCAPALDAEWVRLVAGREIGDRRTLADAKAWQAGWMQANLSEQKAG